MTATHTRAGAGVVKRRHGRRAAGHGAGASKLASEDLLDEAQLGAASVSESLAGGVVDVDFAKERHVLAGGAKSVKIREGERLAADGSVAHDGGEVLCE